MDVLNFDFSSKCVPTLMTCVLFSNVAAVKCLFAGWPFSKSHGVVLEVVEGS